MGTNGIVIKSHYAARYIELKKPLLNFAELIAEEVRHTMLHVEVSEVEEIKLHKFKRGVEFEVERPDIIEKLIVNISLWDMSEAGTQATEGEYGNIVIQLLTDDAVPVVSFVPDDGQQWIKYKGDWADRVDEVRAHGTQILDTIRAWSVGLTDPRANETADTIGIWVDKEEAVRSDFDIGEW